jgi:hypothetical protein
VNIIQAPGIFFGYPSQGVHGRSGVEPVAICHHTIEGTMAVYLRLVRGELPGYENAAHYSIGVDGTIRQHVAETDAAWTNGLNWTKGSPTYHRSDLALVWLAEAYQKRISPNNYTITIELEGKNGTPLTAPQYASLVWLDLDIMRRHPKIKPDRIHLVGHGQIDGINKQGCPGSAFPWGPLVQDLQPPAVDPAYELVGAGLRAWLLDHPQVGKPRFKSFFQGKNELVWCSPTSTYPDGPLVIWRDWAVTKGVDPIAIASWKGRLP